MSLRKKQTEILTSLLKVDSLWKILIYDKVSQAIISPILKVSDLRELGVTIYLPLLQERQQISDVPAVYFVSPTRDSIRTIATDLENDLYESVYIHFTSFISRELLEELVSLTVKNQHYRKIHQICDQYVDFCSLEEQLFSLELKKSFYTLNRPHGTEGDVMNRVDEIVQGLFSVCSTLSIVPIIKASRGNAAQVVGKKLEAKMRDALMNTRQPLLKDSHNGRTLLLLLDRQQDLNSMVRHGWSYMPLVHDIFKMNLNRFVCKYSDGGNEVQKVVDIDSKDTFWTENAFEPFPQVAENIDKNINLYKQQVTSVTKNQETDSMDTEQLKAALGAVPKLTERKRVLDLHMASATALLQAIKERGLDNYVATEESGLGTTLAQALDVLKGPGTPTDKLRFVLYFVLLNHPDSAEMIKALSSQGVPTGVIEFVQGLIDEPAPSINRGENSNSSHFFKIQEKINTQLMSGALSNLMSGVKKLLPTHTDSPLTSIVDQVLNKSSYDGVISLDPTINKPKNAPAAPKFTKVVVFVVGGGNYYEYQNITEYAKRTGIEVVYGATEIVSPEGFIEELQKCIE